jgi:hypothetical protein
MFNNRNSNHFNTINNSNSSRNIFNNQNSNSFNTINNEYSSNNPLKSKIRKIPINPINNKKPKNFLNFFVEPIKSIVKPKNPYLDFLVEGCKIPNSIFDEARDCKGNWSLRNKTGPPRYLRDYIPPLNWIGIGLKVYGLYDYGDNAWLGNSNEYGEWYIIPSFSFHIDSICKYPTFEFIWLKWQFVVYYHFQTEEEESIEVETRKKYLQKKVKDND